jgi:glycosyltransferase involved in cell wall biosynthesis
VFVLSSDYEGMPNALAEAMAIGLPCVSTDYDGGGVHDLIENNVNGMIVPCNDSNSLATAIISIISDNEMANRIGENARLLRKKLNHEFICQQWYDFFCDVLDNSNVK